MTVDYKRSVQDEHFTFCEDPDPETVPYIQMLLEKYLEIYMEEKSGIQQIYSGNNDVLIQSDQIRDSLEKA